MDETAYTFLVPSLSLSLPLLHPLPLSLSRACSEIEREFMCVCLSVNSWVSSEDCFECACTHTPTGIQTPKHPHTHTHNLLYIYNHTFVLCA
jgi:hypothetical protein